MYDEVLECIEDEANALTKFFVDDQFADGVIRDAIGLRAAYSAYSKMNYVLSRLMKV
jgi:hypothetical protein